MWSEAGRKTGHRGHNKDFGFYFEWYGKVWKVLSRGMTSSDLHFNRITLATMVILA